MSDPQNPYSLPSPPGATGWSAPALGQIAGSAQGVPYQGGGRPMPAPQAWGQAGPYAMARPARPQLSTRARVCLRIELVVWVIALVNIFIPYFFDDLRLYLQRLTDIWFYEWVVIYSVLIVLAAIALVGRNAVIRYVLVGVILVFFLMIDPVLSVAQGGQWYALFTPPTLNSSLYGDRWYASLLVVRSLVIWLIVRTGIVTALVLAVPDRRTPAAVPVGGPFVAAPLQGGYPAPGGAVPPHGANPVAPQGMWPAAAQGAVSAPAAAPAPAQGIAQPGAGRDNPVQ